MRVNFPWPSLVPATLVSVPPKADLEAETRGHVVYWGGHIRKRGSGESETGKMEESVKDISKRRLLLWSTRAEFHSEELARTAH